MRRKYIFGLFALLIVVQIALPVSMIAKREATLKNGVVFRFKTAPVDPYDAFRGRFVALRVEVNSISKPMGVDLKYGQKVFAQLTVDANGFAKISAISLQRPKAGDYLAATVGYCHENSVNLNLPFDRYYMEEKAASHAEQVYREHSRRDQQDAYVIVRIKDGFAVVEGLYIGGSKIEEILRRTK